jgi:hypothetical protein
MPSLDDMTINEVSCFECNKPISSIPPWMAGASVKFQCEECRQKHPRVPGMLELETRRGSASVDELGDLAEVAEEPADEAEDEVEEEAEDFSE